MGQHASPTYRGTPRPSSCGVGGEGGRAGSTRHQLACLPLGHRARPIRTIGQKLPDSSHGFACFSAGHRAGSTRHQLACLPLGHRASPNAQRGATFVLLRGLGKGGGEWGEERWAGGQGGCAASWEADLNHWSTIARLLARFCMLFEDHSAGSARRQLACLPLERQASPLYRGTPRPSASGVG